MPALLFVTGECAVQHHSQQSVAPPSFSLSLPLSLAVALSHWLFLCLSIVSRSNPTNAPVSQLRSTVFVLQNPRQHKKSSFKGGEKAASTAVSACLSQLVRLEREKSAYVLVGGGGGCGENRSVSPEVKLYHLANACLYGASVLSELGADQNFEWLLSR